jgi:peptide/nickel transport system substrate-binding protein
MGRTHTRRPRGRTSTALGSAVVILTALLAGCGGAKESDDDGQAASAEPTVGSASSSPSASAAASGDSPPVYTYNIDNAAKGPAPERPGAVKGGKVRVYDVYDYLHLDPARIYSADEQVVSMMLTRTLTSYRQEGTTITLVGDLATDTGRPSDGGKTWTYTLRDGITWEDGSPITAKDVKYGLERLFVPEFTEGPTYLQEWLTGNQDFRKTYKGPYVDGSFDGIEAPDDKTIVLKFPKPRPDVPFALALPCGAPVKESEDKRTKYDQRPFSSGPYKIGDRKIDKSLSLVRNDKWNADSDPIRYQFVDEYAFEIGELPINTNQRLIAASGDDAAAMTAKDSISPEVLEKVLTTPDLLARTVGGFTPFTSYYAINTRRITDRKVREALLYAFPREQVRQISGGPSNGDFATTIGSPTLVGHEPSDRYDVPPAGDPERAKKLLADAGKANQRIVFADCALPRCEQYSVAILDGLKRAGFDVVRKALDTKTMHDEISDPDNSFDLYSGGWGADWPSGSTVYPVLFDGRKIARGGYNTSFLNDPAINEEMDEIAAIVDPVEAGKRWAAIDRKIMEQIPIIPNLYSKAQQLYGPKIGGATYDNILGNVSLNGIWLKP